MKRNNVFLYKNPNPVQAACNALGGPSQLRNALCSLMGMEISRQRINWWMTKIGHIPHEFANPVSFLTGLPAWFLCPDIPKPRRGKKGKDGKG